MKAQDGIQKKLNNMVLKSKKLRHALLLVHSDKHGFHWKFASGVTGKEQKPINKDNPYHIASIGKTFNSVIIARLYERGKISYDDPISRHIPPEMLENLFVYRNKDYSGEVQVRHLLNHTSGIADYYEDKPVSGKPVRELLVEEPDRFWTPDDTINYTRQNLKAFAAPGERFHYSDTGYNLLGKIIEEISGRPYHENLHGEIFDPLGMVNSYFLYYSEPREKSPWTIPDTLFGKMEVSAFKGSSASWAGGGAVSSTEDLLLFLKALVSNTLIKKETLEICKNDTGKFGFGMDYGYGILKLNISKMTFVLSRNLNLWGNFGSTATYMFYNPFYDIYIIGAFNHTGYVVRQVFFLIEIIRLLSKACAPR
ncbi:MAG: serine hydrolase domain-containing protein [Bacillota bacterium]